MLNDYINEAIKNIKELQSYTTPGSPEYIAYQNSIDEVQKLIDEEFVVNYKYDIEFMRGSSLIGTLSGKNTSGSGGGGGNNPPVNTGLPIISDTTPTVGQTLSVTNGTWTNLPTSYSYQWKSSGSNIVGATASTFLVTSTEYNTPITCTVTAINSSGSATATSAATSNVIPAVPVNTDIPIITGLSTSGSTLTCSTGVWSSQGSTTYTYQWTKNGVNISGQTANTYVAQVSDEGNQISCKVVATNPGGASAAVAANAISITNPSLSTITTDHVYSGTDKLMIYNPKGLSSGSELFPVEFFGHGDGERGVSINSSTVIGTGNGVTTSFPGNLSNTNKIVHCSVYVTVNGVQVASGRLGVLTGTGVTGTYNYDDGSSAAVTLVFSTPPANGHQIRWFFTQSNLLGQGPFRYANLGDDPNCFRVCIQISRSSGGYTYTDVLNAINYLQNNNYRINWNRLYATGLSLGNGVPQAFLNSASTTIAAYVMCAASPSGVNGSSHISWANMANQGKLYIQGASDTAFGGFAAASAMANNNGADRPMPCESLFYWNIGHSSALWDTKCYNRKYKTTGGGTADIDYLEDFLFKYSLDPEEQAQLFVTYAVGTGELSDYRKAKKQVDALGSGPVKTQLLLDLVALKAAIGKAVIIDFGTTFYATAGNVNNITSPAVGTTLASLKDDEGGNTGFTITITSTPDTVPAMLADIGAVRFNGRQHGFEPNTNRDGMRIDTAGTSGGLSFGNLNNAHTYTLKIYAAASNSSFAARAEIETLFGGVTKFQYVDLNNVLYIKYTGLVPSSGVIAGTIKQRLTSSTERIAYLQAAELIREV